MNKALLIIAHGSRLGASNDEVIELRDSLESILGTQFSLYKVAFLELCDPSITQAISELATTGVREIVVLPYFLNKGRHVTEDVPGELQQMREQYPHVSIKSLPYFGSSGLIPGMLKDFIESHG